MTTRSSVGGRSGVSPVTLIVFIILAMISGTVLFMFYTEKLVVEEKIEDVTAQLKQLDDDISASINERGEVQDRLEPQEAGQEKKKDAADVAKYFAGLDMRGITVEPKPRNFPNLILDLERWTLRLKTARGDMNKRIAEAGTFAAGAEAARDGTARHYVTVMSQKKADYDKLVRTMTAEVAAKESRHGEIVKLQQAAGVAYEKAQDARDDKKRRTLDRTATLVGRNAVLRRQLRVLNPVSSIAPPSGKVLRSDWRTGKVAIGLGERDHVFPGLRFDVYYFDKEGNRVVKGRIEVTTVRPNSSVATVLESNDLDPIVAGDTIQTPFLPVPGNRKFVIAGFIPPEAVYDRRQLKSLIELNGGEVQSAVNLYTDMLILGETVLADVGDMDTEILTEAQKNVQKGYVEAELAKELGITVVSYREFVQKIGR